MDILNTVQLNISQIMYVLSVWGIPILMAITFHEAAHGYAAMRYGDPTALSLGRVTLNPIAHISLFGTILLPALFLASGLPGIGYAKPVPVNFRYLKPFKQGVIVVALAGPAMNLFLALFSFFIAVGFYNSPYALGAFLYEMAWASLLINILLMLFNLIPIPPLDGSRVVSVLLPPKWSYFYGNIERFGLLLIIVLAVSGLLGDMLQPLLKYVMLVLYKLILLFNI